MGMQPTKANLFSAYLSHELSILHGSLGSFQMFDPKFGFLRVFMLDFYIYITEESYLMYCNVMYVCLFEESISCMYGLSIGITSCCMLLPLQQRMHVHSWCCQAPKINNTAFFLSLQNGKLAQIVQLTSYSL